jgi:hypothetical protein
MTEAEITAAIDAFNDIRAKVGGIKTVEHQRQAMAAALDAVDQLHLRNVAQLVRSQPLRDQFERWAETDHRAIEPEQFEDRADDNNQYYQDDSDNSAFIGWKAALSSAQRGDL